MLLGGAALAADREACAIDGYVGASLRAGCRGGTGAVAVDFACDAPPWPAPPAGALRVTDFGAVPDDGRDDAPAIQRALDALVPGQWLVFAPGEYLQGRTLTVSTPGVTLWGQGATLKATDPADQALRITADRVTVLAFTLTARTQARGDQPLQSRIAVYPTDERRAVDGVVIRGNRVVDDPAAEGYGNASTAAGIFLFRATGFRVEDNLVRRTLADGIHVTAGSRDGTIARNLVRETGDDTIGLVSYQNAPEGVRLVEDDRVRNVLVLGNDVGGQYWGRGIAVVGGRDIAIVDNTIRDAAMAASVYVARESYWLTDGVMRVLVAGNRIDGNQFVPPAYNYRGTWSPGGRTEQAAIELYTWVWWAEQLRPEVSARLGLSDVALCANSVARVRNAGVRIGAGSGAWLAGTDHVGRRSVFTGGPVSGVTVTGNRFDGVRRPFDIHPVIAPAVACGPAAQRTAGGGDCPQGGGG